MFDLDEKTVDSAKTALRDCFQLSEGERLVVVTDNLKVNVAYSFVEAGRRLGAETVLVEMKAQRGGEPPAIISAALLQSDAAVLITSSSLTHTMARHEATRQGVRIASMPMITEEIIRECLGADYQEIAGTSQKLAEMLTGASHVRIVTEAGSDLTLDISSRTGIADTGLLSESGAFGNLPAGEALIAPVECVGEGVLVVDGSVGGIGRVEEPVVLTITNGTIVNVQGGRDGERLKAMLKDTDNNAWKIAELGIGTNRQAKLIGNPLVDEKVYGTIHVGFGDNSHMGGVQVSSMHYDCIITEPTLYLDGTCVIEKGVHVS
jgi:leucyl aminopeptidase (aminopeptidase T)